MNNKLIEQLGFTNLSDLLKNISLNSTDSDYQQRRPGTFALILCAIYSTLFIFGLIGNVWVIGVISTILFRAQKALKFTNLNMISFMFGLSIVDVLVLTNVPLLICDIYFNRWIFGQDLCKFYWIVESINKLASKFVLAAMSFERYVIICRGKRLMTVIKNTKATLFVLLSVGVTVAVVTCPVYLSANIIDYDKISFDFNGTTYRKQNIVKCVTNLNDNVVVPYSLFIFGFGFCLPSTLIVCFYFKIIKKMHTHYRSLTCSNVNTHIPVKKVTLGILGLILIYFVCWIPFWCVSLYAVLNSSGEQSDGEDFNGGNFTQITLMYLSHLMVYVNSAVNWVFYAYLNRNLKEIRRLLLRHNVQNEQINLLMTNRANQIT